MVLNKDMDNKLQMINNMKVIGQMENKMGLENCKRRKDMNMKVRIIILGMFFNGVFDGKGKLKNKDGKINEGIWYIFIIQE